MACLNPCCPTHNFTAIVDPTPSDCADNGDYCPGSIWINTTTGQAFIGANDMACNTAIWKPLSNLLIELAHVRYMMGTWQSIPTGVATKMTFTDIIWDATGAWDTVNSRFTAPRDGYYKVEVISRPATNTLLTTTGWELGDSFYVTGLINNVLTNASGIGGVYTFQHDTGAGQVFDRIQLVSSATVYMSAGDLFTVNMNQNATGAQTFHPTNTQIIIDELSAYGSFPV